MKIKRFIAENISGAMAQVRAELGPEAVILSNQQRDGQVEIVCAIDYDESRLVGGRGSEPAQAGGSKDSAANRYPDGDDPVADGGFNLAQSRAVGTSLPNGDSSHRPINHAVNASQAGGQSGLGSDAPLVEEIHQTVESLRDLIEHQILDMVWAGAASHQSNTSLAVRKLLEAGFSAETSRQLMADIPPGYSRERALQLALTLLRRKLPTPQNTFLENGGRVAVIGPPGVGKTTLAVGLAARYARSHGVAEVALVGFDNQRVGAQEQLRMYGQLLGMQVHIVQQAAMLSDTLQNLRHKSLVVVDTAGYGSADPALQTHLRLLMGLAGEGLETLLALPAYGSPAFLQSAVRNYRISLPQRCGLTHLDSSNQPGVVMSCLLENQLQAELSGHGSRISEDLEPFDAGRLLARFRSDSGSIETIASAPTSQRPGQGLDRTATTLPDSNFRDPPLFGDSKASYKKDGTHAG